MRVMAAIHDLDADQFMEQFMVHHVIQDERWDARIVQGDADHHRISGRLVMAQLPVGDRPVPDQNWPFDISGIIFFIDPVEDLH